MHGLCMMPSFVANPHFPCINLSFMLRRKRQEMHRRHAKGRDLEAARSAAAAHARIARAAQRLQARAAGSSGRPGGKSLEALAAAPMMTWELLSYDDGGR